MIGDIQVLDYFVQRLSYRVNEAYRNDPDAALKIQKQIDDVVRISSSHSHVEGERAEQIVSIKISVNKSRQDFASRKYRIVLELVGKFYVVNNIESNDYRDVEAAGISILWGFARDIVLSLTSASPFGKFILPTIVAREILDNMSD